MKIEFVNQYRSKGKGTLMFRYKVTGTPEELASYKKFKGEHYREDKDIGVLFFTDRFVGKSAPLIENKEKTKWFPDTTKHDQLANLTAQYGIDVACKIMGERKTEETEGEA